VTDYNRRKIGANYEQMAAKYLISKGYRILETNYHNRYGEIDLIVETKEKLLVICEVKYRSSNRYGSPFEAVTETKRRRICKVAKRYYLEHGLDLDYSCRFDVIGICGEEIVHIEGAFDLC
jgi:putative endonuclease